MQPDGFSWDTVKEGQQLRKGFTTGTCAAAAAAGATLMLFSGQKVDRVEIQLPAGLTLELPMDGTYLGNGEAGCSVKKDAGDDPDVTDGVEVKARAVPREEPGVEITSGDGIGRVTLPGLGLEVGEPAINPTPRRMIVRETENVLPPGKGVLVELSIPGGEELAQKTFNPRLGIKGGLSLLGSTGLVEPMSNRAMQESLGLEIKMHAPDCGGFAVLVPGNYGKEVALGQLELPERNVFRMSNYPGFMLDRCLENNIKRIMLVGHVGKLCKVAAGIFQTHSRSADGRFEVLAAYAALFGASRATLLKLQESVTSEEMIEILEKASLGDMFSYLAERISSRAEEYLGQEVEVGTCLFTLGRGVLTMDTSAKKMWEEWSCHA